MIAGHLELKRAEEFKAKQAAKEAGEEIPLSPDDVTDLELDSALQELVDPLPSSGTEGEKSDTQFGPDPAPPTGVPTESD